MRRVLGLLAAATLAVAPIAPAAAQSNVTKDAISQTLEMQGYSVREFQPNMIAVEVGEVTVLVGVFGSDGDISYFTYLNQISLNEVSHEFLSRFNSEVKFGRAYIDRDGDVTIQMDRNASGGISLKNIESDFDVFLLLVSKFLSDIERRGSV
ncbi:MAG: YbjN domain-containing protein [Pseudomonadota bacterium]